MKDMGAPLYAISSGNEIGLGWTKYNEPALAKWVGKYMGPTLAHKAPDTKVMGIETCNWYGIDGYLKFFKNDPNAWKYSSILGDSRVRRNPERTLKSSRQGKSSGKPSGPTIMAMARRIPAWAVRFELQDDP